MLLVLLGLRLLAGLEQLGVERHLIASLGRDRDLQGDRLHRARLKPDELARLPLAPGIPPSRQPRKNR